MGTALLLIGVILACVAVGGFIASAVMELVEGRDISERGWVRGHHDSHLPHLHQN